MIEATAERRHEYVPGLVHCEVNDDGVLEETTRSIKLRISELFGFNPELVTLLDGDYRKCHTSEDTMLVVMHMAFSVNGYGYSTDFCEIQRNKAYDSYDAQH